MIGFVHAMRRRTFFLVRLESNTAENAVIKSAFQECGLIGNHEERMKAGMKLGQSVVESKKMRSSIAVAAGLAAAPASARAALLAPGAGAFASLILPLLLVTAAGVGAWYLLRRARGSLIARGGPVRMVQVVAVGARERIVVLDAQGERLLVGVTSTQITLLRRHPLTAADIPGADANR
jgi:flagellar protein FliO/FliZ